MDNPNKKKPGDIFNVFFRNQPAMILVALRKNDNRCKYGNVIAKEVDCTYAHTVKILQEMEKARLVDFEKKGRIKLVTLTDKGHKVAASVETIRNIL